MELRLLEARKLKGLSLRDASKILGISHQDLNRLEKHQAVKKYPIDSKLLIKFSKAYSVSLDYLCTPEKKKIKLGKIHWNYRQKDY